MSHIKEGIERANALIFIISDDSVSSKYCNKELTHAQEMEKQIIPVLHRQVDDTSMNIMAPILKELNWIFIREEDDFEASFAILLNTLETDLDYVRTHTRFLTRAVEWQENGKMRGHLLSRELFSEAQHWIYTANGKKPIPTPLHKEYIASSGLYLRQIRRRLMIGTVLVTLMIALLFGIIIRPRVISAFVGKPDLDWVLLPSVTFEMGNDLGSRYESPEHQVDLSDFEMTIFEITNGDYDRCVRAAACNEPDSVAFNNPDFERHPVVGVSWEDARTFCDWVGGRLPTEAEWERAATWHSGLGIRRLQASTANTSEQDIGATLPIGSFPDGHSPDGLFDMSGNVWEWTSSLFQDYPYDRGDGREDLTTTGERVIRGGSFLYPEQIATGTNRTSADPNTRDNDIGIRCVKRVDN